MSTEIEGQSQAEAEGVAAAPETETTTAVAEAAPPPPKLSAGDWRAKKLQERVDRLTREKSALEAQAANQQKNSQNHNLTDDQLKEKIESAAAALAAQREFDRRCEEVVKEGKGAFEDFESRAKVLQEVAGDLRDSANATRYATFIDAIIETGDGARLIYALAGDLEDAERIYKLSPVKQGIELAKLALAKPAEVSRAPKPITAIGSRAASHTRIDPSDVARSDTLSTAEWMTRRNLEAAEAQKSRRGY